MIQGLSVRLTVSVTIRVFFRVTIGGSMVWGVRCRVLGAGVSAFRGAGQDVVSFLAIEFFLHAESACRALIEPLLETS